MSPYGIVYLIRNTLNGKGYVGQTRRPLAVRVAQHANESRTKTSAIGCAMRRYGRDAFEVEVLTECEDQDKLNAAEAYFVRKLNTMSPNGYNIRPGGGPQTPLSPESRRKLAEAKRGIKQAPEVIEKRIAPLRGRARSAQTKRKISAALKGREITWGDKLAEANRRRPVDRAALEPFIRIGQEAARRPEAVAKRRGEGNGNARLTWDEVREIRRLYERGGISQQGLGDAFSVKQTAISRIVRRVTWVETEIMHPEED